MIVPTVKVMREGGRGVRIINASDFDPVRHTIMAEPNQPAPLVSAPLPVDAAASAEPRKRGRPRKVAA